MNTTTLNGSVVNSPDITKQAIVADFALLSYSPDRFLAVNSFDALARLVLEGGAA
jgi:hypothetical protein